MPKLCLARIIQPSQTCDLYSTQFNAKVTMQISRHVTPIQIFNTIIRIGSYCPFQSTPIICLLYGFRKAPTFNLNCVFLKMALRPMTNDVFNAIGCIFKPLWVHFRPIVSPPYIALPLATPSYDEANRPWWRFRVGRQRTSSTLVLLSPESLILLISSTLLYAIKTPVLTI